MARALRAAAASVVLLLSAGAGHAATPRDALVIAWNLDALITFDPAQIGEVNGADIIVNNVCSTLVQYDPSDATKIIPGTAESWSSSPDGLTLTFKLRSDLKFPDGTPATAEDAAWSLQRAVLLGFFSSSNRPSGASTRSRSPIRSRRPTQRHWF
jgi:peptide/nickel transport system substrate-binding protein